MITISYKTSNIFFTIRKIKFYIINTRTVLTKKITITRVRGFIIIFRLRIDFAINIILVNSIYEIKIKILKRNTKLFPIIFIVFIPFSNYKFYNRFTMSNSSNGSIYFINKSNILFLAIKYIFKSKSYMTKNFNEISFVINVIRLMIYGRYNISYDIETISPKITTKISKF